MRFGRASSTTMRASWRSICIPASMPAAQYAGLAALTGPQDAVEKMVAEFDKRRSVVVEGLNRLPGVSCTYPEGAFYAFPNIRQTGWKAKPLANALLDEAGVALIGGPGFRHSGRRLSAPFLRQLDREHPQGAGPHGRLPGQPKGRVGSSCSGMEIRFRSPPGLAVCCGGGDHRKPESRLRFRVRRARRGNDQRGAGDPP